MTGSEPFYLAVAIVVLTASAAGLIAFYLGHTDKYGPAMWIAGAFALALLTLPWWPVW